MADAFGPLGSGPLGAPDYWQPPPNPPVSGTPVGSIPPRSAIGTFVIGRSPIGGTSVLPFDYNQTVISQYANSPTIRALIDYFNCWVNPAADFDQFYTLIWDLDTAQGYGLDVWGRIVNVGRVIQVVTGRVFGFAEQGPYGVDSFNSAPFSVGLTSTSNYALSDEAYLLLILAKAASNICDGSIPSINRILMNLFPGRGNAYVTEPGNQPAPSFGFTEGTGQPFNQAPFYTGYSGYMQMTYTFNFPLSAVEYAIIVQSNVLPKPVGVHATVVLAG